MKEGFTFNKVSLMFLRKVIFKNFGGGGKTEESQEFEQPISFKNSFDILSGFLGRCFKHQLISFQHFATHGPVNIRGTTVLIFIYIFHRVKLKL